VLSFIVQIATCFFLWGGYIPDSLQRLPHTVKGMAATAEHIDSLQNKCGYHALETAKRCQAGQPSHTFLCEN
jgi:hypothetical protein